jgi:RNA polymerase sigma-70 factor (ECF subfamily)
VPFPCAFDELIHRVRVGDQEAAAELVKRYEPEIHRATRMQLLSLRLHRLLDSADIAQCVLSTFFARTKTDGFKLESPEDLLKLLVTMARNKVRDEARRHQAYRRDHRRIANASGTHSLENVVDAAVPPCKVVAGHDLIDEVYRRLSAEERILAQARVQGTAWALLAAERGRKPDALRKRMKRALNRVFQQMGLEEVTTS